MKLERRLQVVTAIMLLLIVLIRTFRFRIDYQRLPEGDGKKRLIDVIDRARKVIPLRAVLCILSLSATRYHSWTRSKVSDCPVDDQTSCPKTNSNQLTDDEILTMRDMVTDPGYRHVSTGVLAILAQRLGKLFASPTTWHRYIRERNWLRQRKRIHPAKPKLGIRTNSPNLIWHIDTTIFRLLDGTKAYLQAVIDNYSRRILAWRLGPKLEPVATATLLVKAYESKESAGDSSKPQSVMVDGGVENFNEAVSKLVTDGLMSLILAQTDLTYSNSLIEAFWRILKSQWLFINKLNNIETLRKLVEFYVDQHNRVLPHSAFGGQTPDEMYFNTGADIPEKLAVGRKKAQEARKEANRNLNCEFCKTERLMAVNE